MPRDEGERRGRSEGRRGREDRGRQRARPRRHGRRETPAEDMPIWTRPEPGERRPAHTREKIAETAIAIADAEGFEAVSMRRIAAELGAGTMTLYHYVRTKDELIALMDDAIMGELLIPDDEVPDGWREGLAEIARRTRAVFDRHPWSLESLRNADAGPNGMRHVEQTFAVAAGTGLGPVEMFELTALVDDYVFGHVVRSAEAQRAMSDEPTGRRQLDAMADYIVAQLETGEFPHLAAIVGDDIQEGLERWARVTGDRGRFERGLQRVLDGIELDLAQRRG
jgi:AcrR family transcriptional regulator